MPQFTGVRDERAKMLVNCYAGPEGADTICFTLLRYTRIDTWLEEARQHTHKTAHEGKMFNKFSSRP